MLSFFNRRKIAIDESHMRNLIMMARSDDNIDKREVETILRIGKERGFTENQVKDFLRSDETSLKLISPESNLEKFEQLYDLTQVMMADGIIEDDEMNFCTRFAQRLQLRKTCAALTITNIIAGIESKWNKERIFSEARVYLD
jgi:uncharacterized membrane protein YebE (DUF533 family)